MRPIISIVGKSNSGKTTLLEGLIGELKRRGYRLAVIKHTNQEFELDKEGKDSWRFSQAGGSVVAVSSADKVAIFSSVASDLSPPELARFIALDYDLILTEGFKKSNNPKIEVHRKEQGGGLLSSPKELLAVVTDEPLAVAVPQMAGDEIGKLADLIEEKLRVWRKEDSVELSVNGAHIPLDPFVKGLITKTLLGMVSSLKGVKEIKSLRLYLRRRLDI
ncbi:MAG: molybdopterin-guanine dinucleotide biosynthesis protein B [Dehalococcoidia bacterium]|nr:MAG: molybdopterin-guanine dinucleotide biosynthesis protein B [Dehalococcoidia bacterium]